MRYWSLMVTPALIGPLRPYRPIAAETVARAWNAGSCCGSPARTPIDDIGFVLAVLDAVAAEYNLDPDRVYATGFGNGGMMAYRLGCEAADRFAAIAPVVSALTTNAPSIQPRRFGAKKDAAATLPS